MFFKRFASSPVRKLPLGAALGLALLSALPGRVHANGWEHAAIPFEALLWGLGQEAAETRARAAESLGYRGQRSAVPFLLELLRERERAPQVRRAAYTALGRLGDPRALPPLQACLKTEDRAELRGDCVLALAAIGDPGSLPALLNAFEKDDDPLVRNSVVLALGGFPQKAALALLIRLVEQPVTRSTRTPRQRAIIALGQSRRAEAVGTLLAALEMARDDGARALIVWSLGRIGDSAAREPLSRLLTRAESPELRIAVAVALGAIRDGSSRPTLVALLADDEPAVRLSAVRGLRNLGEPRSAAPLSELYRELDRAVADLKAIEQGSAAPALSALHLQKEILRALIDLAPEQGVAALLAGAAPLEVPRRSQADLKLAERLYERRRVALYGLGYTGAAEAGTLLAGPAGLGDPDARLRATAVRSLAVLGRPGAAGLILPALGDPAPEVRWTAAMALGRLAESAAVGALLERLADRHGEVRRQAALGLGYLGDPRALEAVERLASADPAAPVRAAAAYAAELLQRGD